MSCDFDIDDNTKFELKIEEELKKIVENYKRENKSEMVQANIHTLIDKLSNEQYQEIVKKLPNNIKQHREDFKEFYAFLEFRWGKSIDLLEVFWLFSVNSGQKLNEEYRREAESNKDILFPILKRLHGRACLVTGEIISLLRNGYPDGAMARWRSLYEILITSNFIKKHGEQTARRFLEYERIEEYREIENYQKCAKKLKKEPISDEDIILINKKIQPLKEKYGKNFNNSYGWAAEDLNFQWPSFKKLVDKSDFSHYFPYYTWASYPTHSNAKSITQVLGQPQFQEKVILAGPSDAAGLAEPGMMAAITLGQINIQFLSSHITPSRVITMNTMLLLERQIVNEFHSASILHLP